MAALDYRLLLVLFYIASCVWSLAFDPLDFLFLMHLLRAAQPSLPSPALGSAALDDAMSWVLS